METLKLIGFFIGVVLLIWGSIHITMTSFVKRHRSARKILEKMAKDAVNTKETHDKLAGKYPYAAMQAKRGFIKK